jgi:hypothetical protein
MNSIRELYNRTHLSRPLARCAMHMAQFSIFLREWLYMESGGRGVERTGTLLSSYGETKGVFNKCAQCMVIRLSSPDGNSGESLL